MTSRTQQDESPAADADQAFLIRYLTACDAICPQCGYNLRALTSPRCPECGEALRIGVGLVHPQLRGWLWLAVPLVASAGIGLFFLVMCAASGLPPPRLIRYFRVALAYFCAAVPLAALVVAKRRSVLRMRGSTRVGLTVCAWAALIIATVLVFLQP